MYAGVLIIKQATHEFGMLLVSTSEEDRLHRHSVRVLQLEENAHHLGVVWCACLPTSWDTPLERMLRLVPRVPLLS